MYCNVNKGGLSHGHRQHTQKLVKYGCMVFVLCEWTVDRQTERQTNKEIDRHTHQNTLQLG